MIGLFFEDINYGLDGGLNAQMIENRNFEMLRADSEGFGKFETTFEGLYGWKANDDKAASIKISEEASYSKNNPHYLVFEKLSKDGAFQNKAYDGICLKKSECYKISFAAKAKEERTVKIRIYDKESDAINCDIKVEAGDWKVYTADVMSTKKVKDATFEVTTLQEGITCFDFFSMKPQDAVMGVFRKDLAELLKEIKPDFLRFPGGCVVEGSTLESRYDWKRTVGPVEERRFNWSRWAVHTSWLEPEVGPYHYYGQSYEVGFYEYFLLCEYLKCKAVPVVGVGLACQYQTLEKVDLDDPLFDEYVQDAIDLIEFANGPVTSKWGALRASMGHKEPFNMEMIGVGNEQWEDENSEFFERYRRFEKRIHEAYPEIKCIGTAGPDVSSEHYTDSWKFIREETAKNSNFVYAVDEHYYVNPEWMLDNNGFYDNYSRDIKVFAGEYACHLPHACGRYNREDANTFFAALCEASLLTGLERNQDVVVMASYAPLLARIGYSQWSPNMIWFDGESSYPTPSYYVQKLFSCNEGKFVKGFKHSNTDGLYTSAVECEDGSVVIKAVNVNENDAMVDITSLDLSGYKTDKVSVTVLTAGKDDCNSIEVPAKVSPVEKTVSLNEATKIPALSLNIIKVYK